MASFPPLVLPHGQVQPYAVRVSARARYLRIEVSAGGGVVVVLPSHCPPEQVGVALAARAAWIEKHLQRLRAQEPREASAMGMDREDLPASFSLAAVGQVWTIRCMRSASLNTARLTAAPASRHLYLSHAPEDRDAPRFLLRRWLKQEGERHLFPLLATLAAETGLRYDNASLRHQRGRWGSCSSRRSISLNAQLLFLPPPLVRHVLLHELCHLREMNHGPRFWALLKGWDPDTPAHREALRRTAWQYVPAFFRGGS
ncbi:MAG: M48 family metallopeptidase [Acidithiobacillus sp.]|uniref:M48 family metallopeptidase n=1 Tax=Acidithiobacillus sp. TaxID=1872118 RepID=UPI003D02EAEA